MKPSSAISDDSLLVVVDVRLLDGPDCAKQLLQAATGRRRHTQPTGCCARVCGTGCSGCAVGAAPADPERRRTHTGHMVARLLAAAGRVEDKTRPHLDVLISHLVIQVGHQPAQHTRKNSSKARMFMHCLLRKTQHVSGGPSFRGATCWTPPLQPATPGWAHTTLAHSQLGRGLGGHDRPVKQLRGLLRLGHGGRCLLLLHHGLLHHHHRLLLHHGGLDHHLWPTHVAPHAKAGRLLCCPGHQLGPAPTHHAHAGPRCWSSPDRAWAGDKTHIWLAPLAGVLELGLCAGQQRG